METKFNFKSQPATSIEQSERLLKLGLKKETADCTHAYSHTVKGVRQYDLKAESTWDDETIQSYTRHCEKMGLFDHWKHPDGSQMTNTEIYAEMTAKNIPAWSLHRLIEMMPRSIKCRNGSDYADLYVNYDLVQYRFYDTDYMHDVCYEHFNDGDVYSNVIYCIEWLIKEGYFNKEYLV